MSDKESASLVPRLRFPEFRTAGDWEARLLGNEGGFLSSLTGKSADDFDAGDAKFVTYMNVFSNTFVDPNDLRSVDVKPEEAQNTVSSGDVFFTVSSETADDAGMSSVLLQHIEDCYLNSFCALFRFSKRKMPDPVFTGYLLRQPSVRAYFAKKAQGSTRFNLSKDAFRKLPLLIPSPVEQRKLADCLSSLDELISAQARKVNALKTHQKGLIQRLFPREGETQPRLRFPDFREAGEWQQEELGKLCRIRTGKKDANEGAMEGLYPFFTCADKHIYSHSYSFDAEALLIAGNANVGQTKYYKGKFEAYQRTYVLTDFGGISVSYLYAFLSASLRDSLLSQVQVSAMSYIKLPMLQEFGLAVPPSSAEQQKVADCLSALDELIAAQARKVEALKTEKKGLMQQLFPPAEALDA